MKKMLMTVIAAGALAVPVGATLAQSDASDPTEPVPTCENQDHVRNRANEQDPAAVQGQQRAHHQFQHQLGDGTGDGTLAEECDGDHAQDRDRVRLDDGTGEQVQARHGEMNRGPERNGKGS